MTQAELAEKTGYPRERISAWESPNARHGIHDTNAKQLAEGLSAPADALTKRGVQETLAQEVRRLAEAHEDRLEELAKKLGDVIAAQLGLDERVVALEARHGDGGGAAKQGKR